MRNKYKQQAVLEDFLFSAQELFYRTETAGKEKWLTYC